MSSVRLGFYGALGAIVPDALILYSKRWSMPAVDFDVAQYLAATALYVIVAAIVAAIFPNKTRNPWTAFTVGLGFPVIIGAVITSLRGGMPSPRGSGLEGTLLDLMALF